MQPSLRNDTSHPPTGVTQFERLHLPTRSRNSEITRFTRTFLGNALFSPMWGGTLYPDIQTNSSQITLLIAIIDIHIFPALPTRELESLPRF